MARTTPPPATGGGGGGAVDSVNGQTGVVVLDGADLAQPKDWAIPAGFVVPTAADFSQVVGPGTCTLTDEADGSGVIFEAAAGTGVSGRFRTVASFGIGSEFVGMMDCIQQLSNGFVLALAGRGNAAGLNYGYGFSTDSGELSRTALGFTYEDGVGYVATASRAIYLKGPVFQHVRNDGSLRVGWSLDGVNILVSTTTVMPTIDRVGIFADPGNGGVTAGRLRAYKLTVTP